MNLLKKLFGNRPTGMRLSHVIERVYLQPMLITPEGFSAIDKVITSKLANDVSSDFRKRNTEEDDATGLFGDPLPAMEVANKVAYIPIVGPIGYKVSMLEKTCGVCDVGDLKRNVKLAREDDLVECLLLDISSPGGSVTHVAETADYIAETAKIKPVIAFTDDLMASAAYYLGAGATEIYSTPSAEVGSIGAYMALLDWSKMYEQAGVKVELFVGEQAKYKALGLPGLPLTDAQREHLQASVDQITRDFKGFVKTYRPQVKEEAMQGQTVFGNDLLEMGLVDTLVNDIEEVIVSVD